MIIEINIPHKVIAYEKTPVTIYPTSVEACRMVAAEIATLIKEKQRYQ